MTVHTMLARQARTQAERRSARLAQRVAVLGAAAVAVALLLARLGVDIPGIWTPPASSRLIDRVFGYLVLSMSGLVQGLVLLGIVFGAAWLIRIVAPPVLRWTPARTAAALDFALRTDRYRAALEATGVMSVLAADYAVEHAPPADALAGRSPGRLQRWGGRLLALLALLVAVSPGTAPGGEGRAPVAADPAGGTDPRGLVLKLIGGPEIVARERPVIVQVLAETNDPPAQDLDLEVLLAIDEGEPQRTRTRLFLPAGAASDDAVTLDLRRFIEKLKAGEHVAVAHAGGIRSNEYRFVIKETGQGGGAAKKPKPKPQPKPKGGSGPQGGAQPRIDPKFVKPLVREGEKVRKKARVPIEVPGGAPTERTLDEAWPELQKRQEAALKRPGLSPRARKLVKEYFDTLRPADK